jgi:hypothetical protein
MSAPLFLLVNWEDGIVSYTADVKLAKLIYENEDEVSVLKLSDPLMYPNGELVPETELTVGDYVWEPLSEDEDELK